VSTATDLTLVAWFALEVSLRVRETAHGKGGRARDRGTRALVAVSIGAPIGIAAASNAPQLGIPTAAGLVVMWLGLATRLWAVVSLGRSFRTTVEVDPDQAVITTGPYRWIRHPSYTGLLLLVAGFGLTADTWLSIAVCFLAPLPAVLRRIHVEEAELEHVLGDAYRTYRSHTRRLVPGVW
jgi:protein-S-isoprenylcysteine O-methyltransferase Ste14